MRRRTFIAACCSAAAAGCSAAEVAPSAEDSHPLAGATLTVRVENASDTDHDVETVARESLVFWETDGREYLGFDVEFELSDREPDIVIAYADDPSGCAGVEAYSEQVLGCAPLIRPGNRVPEPVTAHVVAGDRPVGKIRVTTKHELGHILGLDHDDEPRWIMSDRPEDRLPLYDVRREVYEAVLAATEHGNDATRQFNEGTTAWRAGEYGRSEQQFRAAHDGYGEMRGAIATAQEQSAAFDGHDRVETVDLARLRALLGRLSRRASAAEWIAFHMAEASHSGADGDRAAADSSVAEANEWSREYAAVEQTEVRDVAVALGLVRGFDRDEPVLDEDVDTP